MRPEDEQLRQWNREGLIPGPEETDEQYIERAQHCLILKHELKLDPDFIVKKTDEMLVPTLAITHSFFDIMPNWIPLVFGNRQLAPWHGACAWIFQMTDPGPLGAFIQLRKSFLNSPVYMGMYSREELIAHELSHAGRMAFQEPKYEELLAYRCSKRWIPRNLGPLIESSMESMIFLLTLIALIFVEGISIFYGGGIGGNLFFSLVALPVAMLIYAFIRLACKLITFKKCQKTLTTLLQDPLKVNGVLYRLTDKEFALFAKMTPEEVQEYAASQKLLSLRWYVIAMVYLA